MQSFNHQANERPLGSHPIQTSQPKDWTWPFWFTLPLYPYKWRRTIRTEVIQNTIWTFDQPHGILYTVIPIRMTVVKLETGGLFVYAPTAPTNECIQLVNELVAEHGDVKYILLPTSSGLEHKVFVGPFAQQFPQAQVFVAPHQWSYPLNLPLSWLGFPSRRTHVLPEDSHQAPFADEFDYAVLDINLGRGSFAEVAVLHRRSQTLLLTDTILSVPENPPAILEQDPYPLLFHARDSATEPIENTPENRRKGWQRIALFAIYFRPAAVELAGFKQTWRDALHAPDRSRKAYFGLFPFRWQHHWRSSFAALRNGGHPFVAPILQTLILIQAPRRVLDWADQITQWDFSRIIPCHFDAPIATNPRQFRAAFGFLEPPLANLEDLLNDSHHFMTEDLRFIQDLEATLMKLGVATPPRER
jgi:hypothetical protein